VVEESADAGRHIALTSNQQLAGVQQISSAMRGIEQATKDNAAGAHQLESSAQQVTGVASRLQQLVSGASAAA
jgi:methyl-accepting chemotaxis protein